MNSERSVIEKLNFAKYPAKLILHKPDEIADFNEIAFDTTVEKEKYDLIFIFIFSLEAFSNQLNWVIQKQLLENNGYVYFAYPKKNNARYPQYIDRDSFIAHMPTDEEGYILNSGLKFARMVSLNDVFTVVGLKSKKRKASKATKAKSSQRVGDYIHRVNDIQQFLKNNEDVLAKYNQLAPGYQKDWARYVYSAKQEETREKRLLEMEALLAEGYKSIALYRIQKKQQEESK